MRRITEWVRTGSGKFFVVQSEYRGGRWSWLATLRGKDREVTARASTQEGAALLALEKWHGL